ncbi:MAG: PAS domain S-box protein, partial [Bacteroidetes bacterium]|nr:PAS domain S-box protein [Bacteroidota bacterium]
MFQIITPVTYWVLILLWSFILYFYVKKMWSSKTQRLFSALVLILAIDAFRTLFESVYFGLWYTSLSGIISPKIGALLTRPELVIIPKILNVIAAVVVIVLLLRKWLPKEEKEQERAAEVLRESENRYFSLFAHNHSVMLIVDPENGSIVDANLAACDYYGYSIDQLTGMQVAEINILSHDEILRKMAKAISGKKNIFQFQHKLSSGEIRDVEVFSGPISLAGKQLLYSIVHDVTDRKVAQRAVESRARQYHGMLQSTRDGFWIVDRDGMIVDVNNSICEMLGYTRDQLLTMSIADVDVEENDEDVRQHVENIITTGYDRFESRHKRKDGSVLDVEVSSTYIQEHNGYFCTFIRDITDRKKAEENKNRILEASIGGIYIYDLKLGRNIYMNRQYTTLTGYTFADISSMKSDEFASLFHPEDQEKVFEHMRVVTEDLPDNSNRQIDYRFKYATGGWKWFRSCDAVYDRDVNGKVQQMIGTFIDITQNKRLEGQLQQAHKMEAIGTLAGGIAHDFNNILAAIVGYTEMARDDSPPGSTIAKDLDKVLEGGNRAKDLVQQILAFSRQDEMKKIPLQPASVVKEAIKMLRPSLPTTIEINQ